MLHLYSSSHEGRLFVGVAGWAYPQWQDLLEVETSHSNLSALVRLRELFNLVEITSTYYHPPDVKTVKSWLTATQSDKPFHFTARLWNKLVRERTLLLQSDLKLMKAALTPLQEADKLGALVVPVAPSLRYSESNETWLLGLLDAFAEFPLFVENLHASWQKSDTLLRLQDRGVGVVELAQSEAANFLANPKPNRHRCVYIRCEGAKQFAPLEQNAEREAHLYSEKDLASLAVNVKALLPYLSAGFVIFNNHAHGGALANALQLSHAVNGPRVAIPSGLLQSFPALQPLAHSTAKQRDLFKESI